MSIVSNLTTDFKRKNKKLGNDFENGLLLFSK
jgi:hypothetical protein